MEVGDLVSVHWSFNAYKSDSDKGKIADLDDETGAFAISFKNSESYLFFPTATIGVYRDANRVRCSITVLLRRVDICTNEKG